MKKLNSYVMWAIICLLSFASSKAMAQSDSSGIYKTASDFQQKKLSYAINYKTENHKINDDVLFNNNEIIVKHQGEKFKLDKNNTYGYKNTKGEVFRFVDTKEYLLLNPAESIFIYAFKHRIISNKGPIGYTIDYFYSIDAPSIPQPLTKNNLKASFPNNHNFHDLLDENFKTDEYLAMYDSFHKMYKINYLIMKLK